MKLVLKIAAGILLAGVLCIGGCAVMVGAAAQDPDVQDAVAELDSETVGPTKKAEHPNWTSGQLNAVESAESYLDTGGFSRQGLIHQLSSNYADDYSKADAAFAVKHVKVDWNKEAVQAAKSYLETGSFSETALVEQLSSSYADKFTEAQAQYAVGQVY